MKIALNGFAIFCLASVVWADGKPPDFSQPLSADECVKIALERSPSVVKARAGVTEASAGRQSAWSGLVPQVTAQGSYSHTGPGSRYTYSSSQYGQVSLGGAESYSGSIVASQSLFDVRTYTQVVQANKGLEAAKAGERGARGQLVFSVKQAYYDVVRARRTVQAAQSQLDQSAEQEKRFQEMRRLGSISKADLLKIQIRLSQSKTDLLTAQNGEAVARANLCAVMGIDVNAPVEVQEEVTFDEKHPNLADLLVKAQRQRPDLVQARATFSGYKAAATLSRGQYLPRLSADASYSYRDRKFPEDWPYVKERYSWNMGLSASWTVFDGLVTHANIRTANARKAASEADLRAAQQSAEVEVKQAYLNYTLMLEKVKLARETLGGAEEDYRLTSEKQRLGAATTLDLLTSQATLTQARVQEASTLCDLKIAEAAIARAIGE
jgi:outer membrane protein TolC